MSKPDEQHPDPKLASGAFSHLVGCFRDRVTGLFDQLVDVLLGMAEKSGSVKDQHLYFDSMRVLRQSRGDILNAFENNLKDMGKNPGAVEIKQNPISIDSMELVTNDEVEESVTLTNLAQRITNRAGDEIKSFDIRIDSITDDENFMNIPPEIALRALEAALRQASLEFETRQVVYEIIESQAVNSLANVYAEMNQWLINQGVMPRIPLGYVRRNAKGRRKNMTEAIAIPNIETVKETPAEGLRAFSPDGATSATEQSLPESAFASGSSLQQFNPEFGSNDAPEFASHVANAGQTFIPHGTQGGGMGGGNLSSSADWPWEGDTSEIHIPWLSQQLERIRAYKDGPVTQALVRISPALTAAASRDLSIMHDRRHPMRRALTLLDDLIVDLDSEDNLDDVGAELTHMIALMEARAASGPGFWLHVIKYLNYLKDELHTRLWSDDLDANHQERVHLARRLATRQIQLLMRDMRVTPALQLTLSHMLGPALAILMLRHRHDRDSQVLRNAMQLVHEVIESVQDLPESLEDMHYLEHSSGKALIQRMQGFFMGFSGFDQALIAETLEKLHHEHNFILNALESRNRQVTLPVFTKHPSESGLEEASRVLRLPALPSPEVLVPAEPELGGSEPDELGVQVSLDRGAQNEGIVDALIAAPSSVNAHVSVQEATHATEADSVPPLEPLPPLSTPPANQNDTHEEDVTPPEADMGVLNSLALDALLEKIMREHRFTWFQVQACEGCGLRRLMFGAYERERRLVVFTNVRQEPSLTLSVVDFDAGIKSGKTSPIYDEPALTRLLKDYIASSAASAS